jgi:hypothetical protein
MIEVKVSKKYNVKKCMDTADLIEISPRYAFSPRKVQIFVKFGLSSID